MNLWLVLLAIWLVPAVPTWLGMLLLPLRRYGWPGWEAFALAAFFTPVVAACWPVMLMLYLSETIDDVEFRSAWLGESDSAVLQVEYRIVQVDPDALESIR